MCEITKTMKRFNAKYQVDDITGCWNWTGHLNKPGGYGVFWDGTSLKRAHRFIFELVFGPIPGSILCLHECDNPKCVNPEHLWLGTQALNMRDCAKKGRVLTKLKADQVLQIRKRLKTQVKLAEDYKVSQSLVSAIQRGKTWKHLENLKNA